MADRAAPSGESRRRTLLEALPLALGLLVLGWVRASDGLLAHPGSHATLAALALVLALAYAPGAARTVRANGRRAAILAVLFVEAYLAPYSEAAAPPGAGVTAETVARALALLAAALELGAFVRERGAALPAPENVRRASRWAFGLALVGLAALLGPYRLLAPERRIDLASLPRRALEGHARLATLPLLSLDAAPETARVLEDGRPLAQDGASLDAIAALGSGRFAVLPPRAIVWSSTDGTDPLTNGRRGEVVFRPDPHRSVVAEVGFALAVLLLLAAWSTGALEVTRASPVRERVLALGLVGLALAASLPGRWDQLVVATDSESYVGHFAMRPPLYPAFLDAADARPEEPRGPLVADSDHPHEDPGNRFLGAVRAQKGLAVASILVLLAVLAGTWNAWLLAAVAWVVVQADLATYADGGAAFGVSSLLSEGLSFPLTLLLVAAAIAYLRRPAWLVGFAVSGLVALLVLVRPANAALGSVFAWIALAHALRGEGARRSLGRAGALALACALPLLVAGARVERAAGVFRLHAATGMHVFGSAFEVATPEDEDAFDEPVLRRFLHACLVDRARDRIDYGAALAGGRLEHNYIDQNIYAIGLPELGKALVLAPEDEPRRPWIEDDLLARVGRKLIARHPLAFARLVARQILFAVGPWLHVPLALACALAALRLRRTRSPELLAWLFLATLPLVAILPSCVFNFPHARYRSQLLWAELAALPLFLALVLARAASDER